MSGIRDDEIYWEQKQKGQFLGRLASGFCAYFLERVYSGPENEWALFLNHFPVEKAIAHGRVSYCMRVAEIHLIRNG